MSTQKEGRKEKLSITNCFPIKILKSLLPAQKTYTSNRKPTKNQQKNTTVENIKRTKNPTVLPPNREDGINYTKTTIIRLPWKEKQPPNREKNNVIPYGHTQPTPHPHIIHQRMPTPPHHHIPQVNPPHSANTAQIQIPQVKPPHHHIISHGMLTPHPHQLQATKQKEHTNLTRIGTTRLQ
ncbi:hypothetical protein KFK09_014051 [Dendrobium nobile]|uniref:Uncharacterized protein n=1 Tax=Dendrobium nobile TaxID=94219 RepID=A0A8T3B8W1_DENNO|nr:hypothetical protein KFK09_014051 [Dendrobium nobile]